MNNFDNTTTANTPKNNKEQLKQQTSKTDELARKTIEVVSAHLNFIIF